LQEGGQCIDDTPSYSTRSIRRGGHGVGLRVQHRAVLALDGSTYYGVLKHKPRKCSLGGRFGYQQVDLVKTRWRSWGGGSAYGRGTSVANMGVRARVRVKLYRPVDWEDNTDRFTRARFNFNGQGWGPPLVLRLN
jgi:hypothetical protein